MKEVIGSFTVTDGTLRQQTVFISQETIVDSTGTIIETIKHLNLNSVDGEKVFRGVNENTLTLGDGTVLKKASAIRFGEPENFTVSVRRSSRR